jgi:LuxR family transcriptional regulator, maltose regulon positive regulatory protein
MPKAAAYLLIWRPEREIYELRVSQSNRLLPVAPASQEWFTWLAAVPSFTFRGQAGQLTVRQEARSRGGTYWYASRRVGEHMVKRYLGRTPDLTPARLEEVAALVAEAAFRAGQETLAPAAHAQMPAQHALHSPSAPLKSVTAAREALPPFPQHLYDVRLATKLHVPRLRP